MCLLSPRLAQRLKAVSLCACLAVLTTNASAEPKTGVGLNKISLPSGPGSIEGLGDSFEPQLNSGTSSYSVKIAAPPGVAGLQPDIVLRYNSGGGNGPFGIAWSAGFLCIQRQTEKGLPTYGPGDRFTLGGEELVPLADGSFRTENESAFQRVIRQGSGWVIYEKNGTRRFLGSKALSSNPSRVVRPGGGETFDDTFLWCVDEVVDVHGNRMEYLHSTFPDSPGQIYCTEIRYSIFGANHHAITLDYEMRPDAFSSFLSGFEVKTGRRCHQIRVVSSGALVRRYGLSYTLSSDDPIEPVGGNDAGQLFSLLRQVTQFDRSADNSNFLPPLRLGYTRFNASDFHRGSFVSPSPYSLGNPNQALTDFNADGLPDFLFTDPLTGAHQVIYNHGLGRFSAPVGFVAQPTGVTLDQPGADLADYDGDGRIDLVQKAGGSTSQFVFFPNTTRPVANDETHPSWGAERTFATPYPPFDLDDPSVRTLDLNGDKRIDFMRTTAGGFVYFYNRGTFWEEDGIYLFGEPQMGDITYADALDFTDGAHVELADMNGDRLLDLARVHLFQNQLEILYWPNKGRGSWGVRQPMSGTIDVGTVPIEDVFVRDVNGDGLADVVAVAYDHVSYWLNLGNDAFSRRFEVSDTPEYIKGTTVLQQADINGNGTTDFLWENWDPAAGAWRIGYVDFVGAAKPNLLAVIDNGIGLRTEISYRPSSDFYVEALRGGNPWHTRVPFPSWCVSRITKRFGLDLDSVPGEDSYVSEFSYFDGYYDTFEKEFRGFAFARKVDRGDDRGSPAGAASGETNSPSTITRIAFHTGLPDGLDNNGDTIIDEFDETAGYEEEAMKGKPLWTETTLLTAEFDGFDSDGDGFVDESDEGPGSGNLASNAGVFTREWNTWQLKPIHTATAGHPQQPYPTLNGQKVTFPFAARTEKEIIEAVGTLHGGSAYPSAPVTQRTETDVDFFGNPTQKRDFGVISGGPLAPYDDERFTATQYGFNLTAWVVGLPVQESVTDENGAFVARTRAYYDNLGFGQVGGRGLATRSENFVDAATPLASTTLYDAYGNPTHVRDPLYGSQPGHQRVYTYDSTFHSYVEKEEIETGATTLTATATYDKGGGVITSSADFNGNPSSYLYDSFFRLTGIVKPGDTTAKPTQVFEYQPGDPVRSLVYGYSPAGDLTLTVSGASPVVSRVSVKSRETAGGGTFDIVQITDGAGHKLGTIEEGATAGQFVYKDVKRYTSRGAERDSYLPFFAGSPDFRSPPPDGNRVTCFMDAMGRKISCLNPPENPGGPRKASRTDFLPLVTVLYDEEDNDPASQHANTPHVQYQDGLGRLVGVDEKNRENGGGITTYPTRYQYDLNDNLTRIIDSQDNQKWMEYDGLKRMTFMHDPDRGVMHYTYDDASNLEETLDAKNQRITMTYDGANRIKTEDYHDAAGRTPDVTYYYDAASAVPAGDGSTVTAANPLGKLVKVADLSGEEHLSYDSRGRTAWKIKRVPDPRNGVLASYQSKFQYDSLDRVIRLDYPDGDHVGYGYNARNLPLNITGGPGGFIISNMAYLASGQLDTTTYGNGVETDYAYDPRLRLRKLKTENPTLPTPLIDFTYEFDGASNITRIDDLRNITGERRNTQVFGYDDLYRLTSVQYPTLLTGSPGSISYSYDRIGNMLSQTSNITATENGLPLTNLGTMSYGGTMGPIGRMGRNGNQPGPHALTAVSGGSRSNPYDDNGNMQSIDGLACTWDFKDRLVATENAQMRAEYTYDYTDRRITKKVSQKGSAGVPPAFTLYIDRTYELREDGSPVKYVWNGETRVARVTRNLNSTERIQRFALQPGWNICALAVSLTNAGTQLTSPILAEALRHDPVANTYHPVGANESLPAGTLLRLRASAAGELALRGIPLASSSVNYPVGRNWLANTAFQPLDLAAQVPAAASLWFFDAATQAWRIRPSGELAPLASTPAKLQPGEALLAVHNAPFTLAPADPTLEVRYYHQDHLGSSSVMSDASGQLVSETAFYPFGNPRQEHEPHGMKEVYGFTQKERDGESGLSYFEARYLSTGIGRFVTVDPEAARPSVTRAKPQEYNSYAWCTNRPVVCTDPNGHSTEKSSFSSVAEAPPEDTASQVQRSYTDTTHADATDLAAKILQASKDRCLKAIEIWGHGEPGRLAVSNHNPSNDNDLSHILVGINLRNDISGAAKTQSKIAQAIDNATCGDAIIYLMGCTVGRGEWGVATVQGFANITRRTVCAPVDFLHPGEKPSELSSEGRLMCLDPISSESPPVGSSLGSPPQRGPFLMLSK
ncbi:MAG: VCBS repeat-containing protein [Verrucomicrobia bacterium]|nr:VCBS repeat-containing protein [Verrucomicrobiota bacterium]